MKGEYTDEKHHSNTTIFTKLHQTQKFPPHHPSYFPATAGHRNFHLAAHESDSPNTATAKTQPSPTNNDGASIEVVRRPRGRPPGSRNRPKPTITVTQDSDPTMSPYVLEIPPGSDVINTLTLYCSRRNSGLCILNGSGTVANITLKQPLGSTVTFHGRFELLSLSGTIIPSLQHIGNNFTISIAGPQGQIVGGAVVAPLFAAATVYVIAASFNNPAYHRLPIEEDERSIEQGNSNGGGNEESVSGDQVTSEGGAYSLAGTGSDVVWAPTPRQPNHNPY